MKSAFPSLVPITVISPFTGVKLQVPLARPSSTSPKSPHFILHRPHHPHPHRRSFCCHDHYSGYLHESRVVYSQTFNWESWFVISGEMARSQGVRIVATTTQPYSSGRTPPTAAPRGSCPSSFFHISPLRVTLSPVLIMFLFSCWAG